MKHKVIAIVFLMCGLLCTRASVRADDNGQSYTSYFRKVARIEAIRDIKVPTPVEYLFAGSWPDIPLFYVVDQTGEAHAVEVLTPGTQESGTIRFLAKPQTSYEIYFDTDREAELPSLEMPDFSHVNTFMAVKAKEITLNPEYKEVDDDNDGVANIHDNCPQTLNTDQTDVDGNGAGDACEDYDHDGVINAYDNCPDDVNRDQADRDHDKIGDVCDHEESRFTERHAWVAWGGIGVAGAVLVLLFTLLSINNKKQE